MFLLLQSTKYVFLESSNNHTKLIPDTKALWPAQYNMWLIAPRPILQL